MLVIETSYKSLYEELSIRYEQLLLCFEKLEAEVVLLRAENQALKAENTRLYQENKELKDKLGLNSKTCGIPSSKELYKIKKEKRKSGKKPGGQVGHKANFRTFSQADEIISIPVTQGCECGSMIEKSPKPYIFQKIEIPPIEPLVTEYHLEKGKCSKCKKAYTASLPNGITTDLLGPRAKAIISSLSGFFKSSKTEVQGIMRDIFNLPLSVGMICKTEHRVSEKLRPSYKQLLNKQQSSKQLNVDETSHWQKDKKKKGWAWIFCNTNQTVLKLAYTRGGKLLEKYLPKYKGVCVSDRYGAYNQFENRQICWAHLARDFERMAHSSYEKIREIGTQLSEIAKQAFSTHRAYLNKELRSAKYYRQMRKLRKRMNYYLTKCQELSPGEGPQLQKIAKNIQKVEPYIWKFADPKAQGEIPMTNNLAERQLRHYVVYRKTSFFTCSEKGDRFLERIISLFLTWRQQLLNPFEQLLTLATA